jgi:diacylglycerol kinase family enzyme
MLREYAREFFKPTPCRITLDGMVLPESSFTGIHIASMSINLGNVLRFFHKADQEGLMHALVGTPTPLQVVRNLPRMHRGKDMVGRSIIDRPCRSMTMEALPGNELLEPIIDGEYYRGVKSMSFNLGPRVRIPKVVSEHRA